MVEYEWAVRFSPDGMNHIQNGEDAEEKARALAKMADGTVLRRRSTAVQWVEVGVCPTCDGYGVLDGLEPCPAGCRKS